MALRKKSVVRFKGEDGGENIQDTFYLMNRVYMPVLTKAEIAFITDTMIEGDIPPPEQCAPPFNDKKRLERLNLKMIAWAQHNIALRHRKHPKSSFWRQQYEALKD